VVTKTVIVSAIIQLKRGFEAKGFQTKFLYIGRETFVALGKEINSPLVAPELMELEIVIVNRPQWLAVGVILK